MKINVKLFAMLADRLPPGSENHTLVLDVTEGTTPRQVIEQMEIPPELALLAMIDGERISPAELAHRPLREGETLAIFPPIAGG